MVLEPDGLPNANLTVTVDGGSPITKSTAFHNPDDTTHWTLTIGSFNGDLDELRISNQ